MYLIRYVLPTVVLILLTASCSRSPETSQTSSNVSSNTTEQTEMITTEPIYPTGDYTILASSYEAIKGEGLYVYAHAFSNADQYFVRGYAEVKTASGDMEFILKSYPTKLSINTPFFLVGVKTDLSGPLNNIGVIPVPEVPPFISITTSPKKVTEKDTILKAFQPVFVDGKCSEYLAVRFHELRVRVFNKDNAREDVIGDAYYAVCPEEEE